MLAPVVVSRIASVVASDIVAADSYCNTVPIFVRGLELDSSPAATPSERGSGR